MNAYRRKKVFGYFAPFLLILALGFLIVLIVKFFLNWEEKRNIIDDTVTFGKIEGLVQVLPWRQLEWEEVKKNDKFLEGDLVRTDEKSRFVINFQGNFLSLDHDTEITFLGIQDNEFIFSLEKGSVWINKKVDVEDYKLKILIDNVTLFVDRAVTAIDIRDDIVISTVEGETTGTIKSIQDNLERIFTVFNSKQIFLDELSLNFSEAQLYSLPMDIPDKFYSTDWFRWNIEGE